MPLSRRKFVSAVFAISAALPIISSLPKALEGKPIRNRKDTWLMVIDLDKCNGCKRCTESCIEAHHVPPGQEWIKVYTKKDASGTGTHFLPRPCMQCENAPCVNVCPVGASFYNTDGLVLIDQNRCIGCRYCMVACPFEARYFNWAEPPHTEKELSQRYSPEFPARHRRGVVEACNFCAHAIQQSLPYCVESCPQGALYFGSRERNQAVNSKSEVQTVSQLLGRGAYRLREELGTMPRVYYLRRK